MAHWVPMALVSHEVTVKLSVGLWSHLKAPRGGKESFASNLTGVVVGKPQSFDAWGPPGSLITWQLFFLGGGRGGHGEGKRERGRETS